MKLLLIFSAILALSLAEEDKKEILEIEDSEAQAANIELLKEGADLKPAASSYPYIPPSQREPVWQKPQNTWEPPKQQPPSNVQSDYYWSTGSPPHYHPPTTTTQVPIIKQEHYIGDRGDYKYEYQLGDGTWVGEQGYFTDPKQTEESLVKKGWYSYPGADGKIYTVTYWADHTGFHAFGDHLPTPPPAVQPGSGQQKPQYDYPEPAPTPAPQPKPTVPSYVPSPKPDYVPTRPPYVPNQVYPSQPSFPPQPPTYAPQPPTYAPQPPTYQPPQQYYPPQNYIPQQPTNYIPYNN